MTKRKWLTIIPVLAVMVLIFWFSARPADESAVQSGRIVALVTAVLDWLGIDGSKALESGILSFIIRKLGHLSEFALLGLTLMLHFAPTADGSHTVNELKTTTFVQGAGGSPKERQRKTGYVRAVLWSALIGVLYACSDEFHQKFVPGRGPAVRDVCIDSVGVLIGIGLMCLILKLLRRKRAGRNKACGYRR